MDSIYKIDLYFRIVFNFQTLAIFCPIEYLYKGQRRMDFFVTFFIFILVIFLYIHIVAQYKTSEDLEIYEMDYRNNRQLQEICELKQPILFQAPPEMDPIKLDEWRQRGAEYDVAMKSHADYYAECGEGSACDYVLMSYSAFDSLVSTKIGGGAYFTEKNHDFIEDVGFYGEYRDIDTFLKPPYVAKTAYDFIGGSVGAVIPMRYHTDSHRYFYVTSGKIRVKMTPYKSRKYLHVIKDYDHYEFWCPINVWAPQEKYKNDYEKLRFVEFDVVGGYILYVPAYWFYSFEIADPDTQIMSVIYNSPVNLLAHVPDMVRYYMQFSTTKQRIMDGIVNTDLDPVMDSQEQTA